MSRVMKFRYITEENGNPILVHDPYDVYLSPVDGYIYTFDGWDELSKKVEQFTGLQDKDGKEVYENDIIEDDLEYLAVVKFGEHLTSTDYYASAAYGWYAERANGDTHSLAQCGTITVRGNIHEHPHLLEQVNE